jgi:hypothetical protein
LSTVRLTVDRRGPILPIMVTARHAGRGITSLTGGRRSWGRVVGAALLALLGAGVIQSTAGATTGPASSSPDAGVNCTTTTAIKYGAKPTKGDIATAGADACFTFSTAEGDVVWLDMAATSGGLSLFEDVFRPGPISTCAGPYGGPGACDVPSGGSGTWTLQVSDSSNTHTGKFDVSIQRLDVGVGCKGLSFGASAVKGKVTAPAGSACFTFAGNASEVVFARAVGISGKLGTPTVLVAGADGSEPCGIDEFGIAECPLTDSGPQTLLVYSSLEKPTGAFRIYSQQLTAPQHCTTLTAGGAGETGDVAAAGDVACLTFAGTDGESATTTLTNLTGTLSPLIDDFRPTGTSACAGPGTSVDCSLDTTGTWTTLVYDTSSTDRGTGSFTATLTSS